MPCLGDTTEISKQLIRTRYSGHVISYQPNRDQYFLIRSVPTSYLFEGDLPGWTLQREVNINLVSWGCSTQGDLLTSHQISDQPREGEEDLVTK